MKTELVNQEKNRIEIKVEFEASEFDTELKKVFDNISQRVNIPGFRKGHVPRKTIEMRFGRNAIHDETIENLLNDNVEEIMKDYDIEPLFAPQLKSRGGVIDGQPVIVNLLVEAKPEIKLPDFEEIEVERLITVVDDAMINDMIDKLRNSQAKVETIAVPDASVKNDSIVTVEFNMAIINADGEETSHSKKAEMATLNMQELPMVEFRDPLIEKRVGDEVVVTIQGQMNDESHGKLRPAMNDAKEDEAGVNKDGQLTDESSKKSRTSMRYDMKIVEIGERILPELTPEFFKLCMGFDCKSEEEFRDAIAQRMLKKLQKEAEAEAEARAVSIIADMSGFEVPGSLVYREMEKLKAFDEKDAKDRYKMEIKDLLKLRGIEYEDYEKQIMSQAWRSVRNMLVIDEVGRKFEIKIEPSDLEEWIKSIAEKDGLDAELLKKAYFKDKDSVNLLVDRVLSDKAVKLVMDKVKIKDVSELTLPVAVKAEKTENPENPENPEKDENPEEIITTEIETEN